MTRSPSPRRAGESDMSCGVFWAREGAVLVKFAQGDIEYMLASGAGTGWAFMIWGGGPSVRGRGWRTRFLPAESPVMWMLGYVPAELRWSSAVQARWIGLGRLILGRVLLVSLSGGKGKGKWE